LELGGRELDVDVAALARELMDAYERKRVLPTPLSTRDREFDLPTAYAVEAELTRLRRAGGHTTIGRKVGYANKAVWRALKLETLVWAHMYDDTVVYAADAHAVIPVGRMCAPRIEPEIVFKLARPIDVANLDPADVLGCVEWLAIGFEIVDCVFADWKFQPSDFVAAFGLHAALVVGEPRRVDASLISAWVENLGKFRVRVLRDGLPVAEGSGRNSLRNPALCLGELASAIAKRPGEEPLLTGELVSSGTLTEAQPIAPDETWEVEVEGLDLSGLSLRTRP
jgi:2-oxo-3-hexenedioate decarboxylase